MTEAVLVDQLEDLLTCSICLETLSEPRTLPCFHSFCKCCLEKFVKRHREQSASGKVIIKFDCPTCRSEFTLKPNEQVEGMTSSYFIRNMLDATAIQRRAISSQILCSRCKEPAINRCATCEMFLGEKCFTAHETWWGDKNHTVLSINELCKPENQTKIKAKIHCKKHENKTIKFYCETCKELICRYCMDFNHPRPEHLCHPLAEVGEKQREELGLHCAILEESLKEGEETLKLISNVTQSLEDNAKEAKDKISRQKEEILKIFIEKLEEKTDHTLQEVDRKYNGTFEPLTKQKTEVQDYMDKLKGSYNLAKNLFEKGNNEEILSSQKMIEENVKKMKAERPSTMKPVHTGNIEYKESKVNDVDVAKLLDKMGEVGKVFIFY